MKVILQPYKRLFFKNFECQKGFFEKKGFLIGLCCGQHQGWGDVSPLDGFSLESYEDAWNDALDWKNDPSILVETPSVQWGIDVACSILSAKKQRISLAQLWSKFFNIDPCLRIETARLYSPNANQNEFMCVSCLKIKVGRQKIIKDLLMIEDIMRKLAPRSIRLDANRSWNAEEALEFCTNLQSKDFHVDFIEEPCLSPWDTMALSQKIKIPVALDESLYRDDWDWKSSLKNFSFCVIKPSLIGSLSRIKKIVDSAKNASCTLVVSSLFESEVGRIALNELAKVLQDDHIFSGLAPSFLKKKTFSL